MGVAVAVGVEVNFEADHPKISADGNWIVFMSFATNLVPGTNGREIFIHNRVTDENFHASESYNGTPNLQSFFPSISADGRFVAYIATSDDLVSGDNNGLSDVVVYDRIRDEKFLVSLSTAKVQGNSDSGEPIISRDGLFIAYSTNATNLFPNDNNNSSDIAISEIKPVP